MYVVYGVWCCAKCLCMVFLIPVLFEIYEKPLGSELGRPAERTK